MARAKCRCWRRWTKISGLVTTATAPPARIPLWLPNFVAAPQGGSVQWTGRDEHLLKRLVQTIARGAQTLALDNNDIEALETGAHPPLPEFFAASVVLTAASTTDRDAGPFDFFLQGIVGPSGVEFLGRLCHGDSELDAAVRDWLVQQEAHAAGAIPAEIVHLPQPRDGNLVCRPHFRRHEILCLGQSGGDADEVCQIPVSDLTLRVNGTRLVLRSRSLERDIVPRLAASHYAPTADLTAYRFLWALQRQDAAALTWQWGALAGSPFLPRVTAGRVVLCRAMWRLDERDLAPLREAAKIRDGALARVFGVTAHLRRRLRIPRHVSLLESDKALPLDLDNVLCAELLAAEAAGTESLTLVEQFPAAEQLCATSPEGHFVHELLLPFRNDRGGDANFSPPLPILQVVARRFPPASEWLYAKIYGSPRSPRSHSCRCGDPCAPGASGDRAGETLVLHPLLGPAATPPGSAARTTATHAEPSLA